MKVADIVTPADVTIGPEQYLTDAVKIFSLQQLQVIPVIDKQFKPLGLLRKYDLRMTKNIDQNRRVQEIMTDEFSLVDINESVKKIDTSEQKLMVVVENGRFIGILSRDEILSAQNSDLEVLINELKAVMDSVYHAIVSIDENQNIWFFNLAAEKILGCSREDVLGRPCREIFLEDPLSDIFRSRYTNSSRKINYEEKTLLCHCSSIIVEDKVIGAIATLQDISELESVTNELEYTRKLKEEMDAIIEASFDSIFVTDADGKVLSVNEAYTRITGIEADEILGRSMYDLVEEGFYDRSASVMVIEEHKQVTFTQKIKTGTTLLVTGNPIFNEKGELVRVLTNGRDITELNLLKQEVEQAHNLSQHYQEELRKIKIQSSEDIVINSTPMHAIFDLVLRLGKVDSTVLIYGESGVGKELIARELHQSSLRSQKPYISINCAAIPDSLLESELFGYEAGAFTGAQKGGKPGIFELANKGTLFLDEIGELPLLLQGKLLRAIQEGEINRLGGTAPIRVDVRLIAATNRDLLDMVRTRMFREDLYYRLNVVPIRVPPLRERKEDIPMLAKHFVGFFNQKYGLDKTIDERLMDSMMDYTWPGNVRELKNMIERAVVTSPERIIKSLRMAGSNEEELNHINEDVDLTPNMSLKESVESYERDIILKYIKQYKSSRKTAKALGVSQTTIMRKAARYGIDLKEK